MVEHMKTITEDDLILLYYGEHEEPGLAKRVAEDPELSRRFDMLCAEMKTLEAIAPPERSDEYGARVWQRIVPQLDSEPRSTQQPGWLQALSQPRFSLAGVFSIAIVAALAFMLGRTSTDPEDLPPSMGVPQVAQMPTAQLPSGSLANIDRNRLLNRQAAGHLANVDVILTQFVNSSAPQAESAESTAEWATDMLVANRLYRRYAEAAGNRQLAAVLAELEPLLIELAHQSYQSSPATRERLQQEVSDGLLFKVRVMNNELQATEDPV